MNDNFESISINGTVAPAFESIRAVYQALWQDIEVGSALCVYYKGEKVIDLWGGYTDREATSPWQANTLVNVYSTTKGLATAAIAGLVSEGKLAFEKPVADYWPEFAAKGKANITVAQLLSHQAGLCGVDQTLQVSDLYDWEKMIHLLEEQAPYWTPGTSSGYHAVTWGYFPGELVRRITGKTLGEYFKTTIAEPLGADFHIGLADTEFDRCATLIGPNRARKQPPQSPDQAPVKPTKLFVKSLLNPSISPFRDACSKPWRNAELAASNGHGTAESIAKVYAAMANGGQLGNVRIMSEAALAATCAPEVETNVDLVTGGVVRRSRGFILNTENAYGPEMTAFGHAGAGGSLGFADPVANLGFGYVMNQMQPDTAKKPRSKQLVDEIYRIIGKMN